MTRTKYVPTTYADAIAALWVEVIRWGTLCGRTGWLFAPPSKAEAVKAAAFKAAYESDGLPDYAEVLRQLEGALAAGGVLIEDER